MKKSSFMNLAGGVICLLWSAILLGYYGMGLLPRYLNENVKVLDTPLFSTLCLVTGAGLGVVGLFVLMTLREDTGEDHDHACCDHDDHDHDHDHHHHEEHDDHHACCQKADSRQTAVSPSHHDHSCCGHDHAEEKDSAHGAHCHHDHKAHDHGSHAGHTHPAASHSHQPGVAVFLITALMMTVPVSWAALRSPHRFSIDYLTRKDTGSSVAAVPAPRAASPASEKSGAPRPDAFTLADLEAQVDKNDQGDFLLSISVLAMNAGDEEIRNVVHGQPVEVIGQVMPESPASAIPPNQFRLFQLNMFCCAADARPLTIHIETEQPETRREDLSWWKIRGIVNFEKTGEYDYRVLVKATSISPSKPPADAYEY